ncbi:Hypothetical protein R9X50_00543500 [Acrodontium crateriforme]|uniref:Uncharacterized protein n=1 Tax=Acrodontium crateriforme TaxID=150365 RepID=A0AAQ3M7Y2_9PEZI|nr:Hypothetical protein R9X50_00543500 [Acrodontium crateriforme]
MSQNGLNGGNSAMYSGVNGNIMPSAGHYSDMQTLMQNMDTLSGWLEQNRQEWLSLQDTLARVEKQQGRPLLDGPVPNGDGQTSEQDSKPTYFQLETALANSQTRNGSLERTYQDQLRLQQLYEDTLSEATERIRQYCFEQQQHVIALHQHYTSLLSQSRNETIEAQLTHQAWQAGLQRVSEGMRQALVSREEEGRPWKKRIAALKEENRILRAKVGWDPPVDSEDESDETSQEPERGRVNLNVQSAPTGVQMIH